MSRSTPAPTSTPRSTGGAMGPHGDPPLMCSARAKSTGERCQRRPIRGGTVCYVHGGAAPAVKAAAARRLAVAEVEIELENMIAFESFRGVTDPLQVLAELAERALATERALAARVNSLAEDDRLRYKASGAGTEQLRAEVALWERWHKQAAHLVDRLAAHDFEGRRVALAEAQGQMVAAAVRRILDRMLEVALVEDNRSNPETMRQAWRGAIGSVVPEEMRRLASVPSEVLR